MPKTSSTRTEALVTLFDLHSKFFRRSIEDIKNEDAYNRLNTQANHIAWLAGATVNQRFRITSEVHPHLTQKGNDMFKDNKGIEDNGKYPAIEEYINDWDMISPIAREVLVSMDDTKLDSEFNMGQMKMTYYDLVSFTMFREASMIGQITLWRRLLNYPGIKYN